VSRALDYLRTFTDFEQKLATTPREAFALERFVALLARLGNPDRGRTVVHVTGTKGKGSTTAFVDAILRAHGVRTMAYTSPHLERWNERIALDGSPIDDARLERLVDLARPAFDAATAAGEPPTFFEAATALAFLAARDAGAEADVLEVGIGGRLDATNVCAPAATIITSIDLDHQRLLGDTHEAIAAEKAGIVKPGAPCFCGLDASDPGFGPIRDAALRAGVRLVRPGDGVSVVVRSTGVLPDGRPGTIADGAVLDREFRGWCVPGGGPHQAGNAFLAAGAAAVALKRLGREFSSALAAAAVAAASLPGRAEVLGKAPRFYLDGAHTPRSIAAALAHRRATFPESQAVLLAGATAERDPETLFAAAREEGLTAFFAPLETPRSADPAVLASGYRARGGNAHGLKTTAEAIAAAEAAAGPEGFVLVLGSFYLVGAVRARLRERGLISDG
jgi:dihydrofolate synthase/folylpolyglutamate synthase